MIAATINPWRDYFWLLGLDIKIVLGVSLLVKPHGVLVRPYITALVYHQFSKYVISYLATNAEEFFGSKFFVIESKLEFQARNTLLHHILLFLEG